MMVHAKIEKALRDALHTLSNAEEKKHGED
jgi:hypothetical protein